VRVCVRACARVCDCVLWSGVVCVRARLCVCVFVVCFTCLCFTCLCFTALFFEACLRNVYPCELRSSIDQRYCSNLILVASMRV